MPPFQGFALVECATQGVALGWLVCAPLVLVPYPLQRRAMLQPLDAGEVEVRPVNVRLQHAADLIRMRPHPADDRGPDVRRQAVEGSKRDLKRFLLCVGNELEKSFDASRLSPIARPLHA